VQATREGQTLRGRVRVRPAQPPQVQSINLQGDREVVVEFDEPISAPELGVNAPKGIEVAERRIDKQRLVLTLAADLKQDATLELTGVRDLAQHPNTMPPTKIVVRPAEWPTDRKGLVFAWRTAAVAVSIVNPLTGKPGVITRQRNARSAHNHARARRWFRDRGGCRCVPRGLPPNVRPSRLPSVGQHQRAWRDFSRPLSRISPWPERDKLIFRCTCRLD
jgi:hypothetical protein